MRTWLCFIVIAIFVCAVVCSGSKLKIINPMKNRKDPYSRIERTGRRLEWLWRFIDWVRYGRGK